MSVAVESGARRFAVITAVMLAATLQFADTTIVNVSLPTIDGNLGASVDEGTWFITAFIVANVIVIPLSPWLSDRFGRKNYFIVSVAGFTVTSMLCGLANSVDSEIACRLLQGAFGGGLLVPAQAIMRDIFPPNQLGKSQALFGLSATIGPTIGPTLGGWLTDAASWRWIFFVNLVPGMLAVILLAIFLRDGERPKRTAVDALGVALLGIGLGALQFVLEEGERNDWFDDPGITALACTAFAGLAAFVVWELRAKYPAVALAVLKQRAVWASCICSFAVGAGIYGVFIIFPQYTQAVLGFPTTLTGYLMMIRAATLVVLFPVMGAVVSRPHTDLRLFLAGGLGVFALSNWWQADVMTAQTSFEQLLFTQVLGGLGLAFMFTPLNVALLRAVEPATTAAALGLMRLTQQVGGSIASAVLVTFVDHRFAQHSAHLSDAMTLEQPAVRAFFSQHGTHAAAWLSGMTNTQALVLAQADGVRVVAIMSAVAIPLVWLLRRPQPRAEPRTAAPARSDPAAAR